MKTGWIEEEDGTHYYREDGTLATGWLTLEEGTYYLDEQGLKTTGWQTIENRRRQSVYKNRMAEKWEDILLCK